jgi:hypothetical protein
VQPQSQEQNKNITAVTPRSLRSLGRELWTLRVRADAGDELINRPLRGEAKLKCGTTVLVSQSNAAPLKAAGWF